MMLAEYAVGERDAAEVLWTIAAVVAALAAWNAWPERNVGSVLGWVAVCLLSIGWVLV